MKILTKLAQMGYAMAAFTFVTCVIGIHVEAAHAAGGNIKIQIDDRPLETDVHPVLVQDRTMLPLRAVFEALGAEVEWYADTNQVQGKKSSTVITLHVDDTQAEVNGEEVTLDVAPVVINDRTMVPVRFIAESLGADVSWNSLTKTVHINQKSYKLTGRVVGEGQIKVSGKRQSSYAVGTTVSLTALPADGWAFDHWEGEVSDPESATTTITFDGDRAIEAVFREEEIAPPPAPEPDPEPTPTPSLPGWSDLDEFIAYVNSYSDIGIPYLYGGTDLTPNGEGVDCSSFVLQMFEYLGVSLPRTSQEQFTLGEAVEREDLQPGDLIFFHTAGEGATHVGIYVGDDQFVSATVSGGVKAQSLEIEYWSDNYEGARRIALSE